MNGVRIHNQNRFNSHTFCPCATTSLLKSKNFIILKILDNSTNICTTLFLSSSCKWNTVLTPSSLRWTIQSFVMVIKTVPDILWYPIFDPHRFFITFLCLAKLLVLTSLWPYVVFLALKLCVRTVSSLMLNKSNDTMLGIIFALNFK